MSILFALECKLVITSDPEGRLTRAPITEMVASTAPPRKNSVRHIQQSYFDRQPNSRYQARNQRYRDDPDADDTSENDDDEEEESFDDDAQVLEEASEEDGEDDEATPLLPLFSAAHLGTSQRRACRHGNRSLICFTDSLPVYNLTHAVRLLIIQRCETTLSWEQLRSPQISQFLIKPIQQQIRNSHFNRATLYALLANCLQFNKEGQLNPGNVGVCKTRGLVSELLAMRLLKEFSLRELIDALSYDFDPLQGIPPPTSSYAINSPVKQGGPHHAGPRGQSVRTSTLEVAIRAQAKRFLAHPLCVRHLEYIWAGTIVFHSAADSLHRYPAKPPLNDHRQYGATHSAGDIHAPSARFDQPQHEMVRRSVTLYDPTDASLFKLSRLRVPRYRNAFSTISYAIMLGLFLAVLIERSLDISALEIVFWFWSAGFMLDEIVGFSEQGFSLYIISVWNAFDIGILVMFFAYYILRLYGILLAGDERHHVANIAYDVLASTAVLLFPRWFAFLDHYRYFSQLLIAFRLMALDLVAVLLLIGITCSGFFVAFSLSFSEGGYAGPAVAYELFQILMGFTPAAWDVWDSYNVLGKILLTMFLMICHFLVVTILITVLTNSFMAIVKNANEEHQFLFAVNVLSMVKSDALFSYIAPSNVLGWCLSPLRYCVPFRHYVRINRTAIKATHFPILFVIFAYEKVHLAQYAFEPAEQVEMRGRKKARIPTFALNGQQNIFSPAAVREPSVTTRYKDRALEEVFSKPFRGDSTVRTAASQSRNVDSWMSTIGGVASPPMEEPRSILDQLETTTTRRSILPRSATSLALSTRLRSASRSMAMSEPGDPPNRRRTSGTVRRRGISRADRESSIQPTDADADDEIIEEDEEEPERSSSQSRVQTEEDDATATTPTPFRFPPNALSGSPRSGQGIRQRMDHGRHASINTIVYRPEKQRIGTRTSSSSSQHLMPQVTRNSPRGKSHPLERLVSFASNCNPAAKIRLCIC